MKDIRLLVASLLIACFVWAMHTFSLSYSASMPCTVRVTALMEGYAPEATAREILMLRGKGTGFYLLRARRKPVELRIAVDERRFIPVEGVDDLFVLPVSDVREKLVEQLGDRFSVDFIETDQLTFPFTREDFVTVPVAAVTDLGFRPQYMQVGEVYVKPDSVQVYGPVKEILRVTQVRTKNISAKALDHDMQGYVALQQIPGLRLATDRVWYEVSVDRYVENTVTLPVSVEGTPAGRTLLVLPSRLELTYRCSFRPWGGRITADDLSLVVDYADYAGAGSTRVIPRLVTDRDIYAWRIEPGMVECLMVE